MIDLRIKTKPMQQQIDAYKKLERLKVGALYMEQGTGKTLTALMLAIKRYNAGKVDFILWLCPVSVVKTIQKQIVKHVDNPKDMLVHGIETLSSSVRANVQLRKLVEKNNVFLIVDESNLVKNHRAKRTERITWLAEDCPYRLILNGTPISRNEADLFSQWYILDWRILGYQSFWSFSRNHIEWDENIRGKIRRTLNVDYLTRKIAPYTYQVTKEECMDLPAKMYSEYYCELGQEQRDEYNMVANKFLFEVDELEPHTIYRLFTALQNVIGGFHVGVDDDNKLTKKPMFEDPYKNPRIDLLLNVIQRYDKKTIIFCKYTYEIETIIKVLNKEYGAGSALKFNGDVKQNERQDHLEQFENDDNVRFLVANKVTAGYGLNLQFCDTIIFYSNDWDYATRSQAEDRVHRIGQNSTVRIIDICADETLDERILANLGRKGTLVDALKREIDRAKDDKELKVLLKEWIDGKVINKDKNKEMVI